ncbi:hypothetical protein [Aporhodopirellula aestuarii]|uniref:Uncharacterized protein n=1 Tax=Aporhodopirellula aestuarii TaxID=2950107 RepID=A0ABT0U736_9BACT|nr:hypothetical protein [Aporhodopirellula aestuarii]MCM2372355.1 hypothetical protein [Aporhodopirellula aestuarii]
MKNQFTDLPADVQSKLRSTKSLCLDLLLPKTEVLAICVSIGHGYRDRIYNLMIVVWMFYHTDSLERSQLPTGGHSFERVACRPAHLRKSVA